MGESKVFTKIVNVDENDNICFCDKKFSKTCVVRVSNNLECKETILRLTEVVRHDDTDYSLPGVFSIDPSLKDVNNSLLALSKHLGKVKI